MFAIKIIANKINSKLKPRYNHQYRIGDIRHCLADISKIKNKLGYTPDITFKEGIDELIEFIKPQVNKIKDISEKKITCFC